MASVITRIPTFGEIDPSCRPPTLSDKVTAIAIKALMVTGFLFLSASLIGASFPTVMPYALLTAGVLSTSVIAYQSIQIAKIRSFLSRSTDTTNLALTAPSQNLQNEIIKKGTRLSIIQNAEDTIQISGPITDEEVAALNARLNEKAALHLYLITDDKDKAGQFTSDRCHIVVTGPYANFYGEKEQNDAEMVIVDGEQFAIDGFVGCGGLGATLSYAFYKLYAKWDAIMHKKAAPERPPGLDREVPRTVAQGSSDLHPVVYSPGHAKNRVLEEYVAFFDEIPEGKTLIVHRTIDKILQEKLVALLNRKVNLMIYADNEELVQEAEKPGRGTCSVLKDDSEAHYVLYKDKTLIGNSPLDGYSDALVICAEGEF